RNELSKIVRRGNPLVSAAVRNLVTLFARLAQATQDRVGLLVEKVPEREHRNADRKARVAQPVRVQMKAVRRGEAAVEITVGRAVRRAHQSGGQCRAAARTYLELKRIDERAVEVVQLPQCEQQQWHSRQRAI